MFCFFSLIVLINISNKFKNNQILNPNQEMYLRKISDQISRIENLLDKTPTHEQAYKQQFVEQAREAEFLIEAYSEQLKLVNSEKVRTGLKAYLLSFLPRIFLNYEEIRFDAFNEAILAFYEDDKYYTKEQIALVKRTLNDRSLSTNTIVKGCKNKIMSNLDAIIRKELADEIIARNNHQTPSNLLYLVYRCYNNSSKKIESLNEQLLASVISDDKIKYFELLKTIVDNALTKPS